MRSKLWQKNVDVDAEVERYTVGRDREMDMYLAPYDVIGSLAHITMLQSIGLLDASELEVLTAALREIYVEIEAGKFAIAEHVEDVHSQVELMLTQRLGDVGKKIHSGRSRNDQVLVDLKLMMRDRIERLVHLTERFSRTLVRVSERYRDIIIPGYTHAQVAMPSSAGLWLGAYAEALVDDLRTLRAAFDIVNRNPLGSAAGYGSSFPLDRDMTTRLMGFASPVVNVIYAQMGRGKSERIVATAMANIAATISRLAGDVCLFNSQNYGFVKLEDRYTTGSSIMPHKKNPDVFELTRAYCNRLQALPMEITLITNNLPLGYSRDLQLIKESFLPSFDRLEDILTMVDAMIEGMKVRDVARLDPRYAAMYSVEEVNRRVLDGTPFRDAYRQVGLEVEVGTFDAESAAAGMHHTHLGSIGNLSNDRILTMLDAVVGEFDFSYHEAVDKLLGKK